MGVTRWSIPARYAGDDERVIYPIYRDQGDTAPAVALQLRVNGSPLNLASSASVTMRVGGTVGGTYIVHVLPATWTVASQADASVMFGLNPSGLAALGSGFPCATFGNYVSEIKAALADGTTYQWPQNKAIPFIVRPRV